MTIRQFIAIRLSTMILRIAGKEFQQEVIREMEVGEMVVSAKRRGIPMSQIMVP